jgi:hypothetical protein
MGVSDCMVPYHGEICIIFNLYIFASAILQCFNKGFLQGKQLMKLAAEYIGGFFREPLLYLG